MNQHFKEAKKEQKKTNNSNQKIRFESAMKQKISEMKKRILS